MVLQRAPLLKRSTQTEVAHTDQRPDLTSSENSIHTAAQRWGGTFKGNEFSRSAYDRAWKSTKAVFSIFSFKESRSVTRIAVTYTREHITDIQENADSLTYYEHWNKVVKYQPHRKKTKKNTLRSAAHRNIYFNLLWTGYWILLMFWFVPHRAVHQYCTIHL